MWFRGKRESHAGDGSTLARLPLSQQTKPTVCPSCYGSARLDTDLLCRTRPVVFEQDSDDTLRLPCTITDLEPILENTTAHSITAFASTSSGLPHDDRVQRIHRRHTCLVWIVNDIDGLGCHRVVQDSSLRVHLPPKSHAQDKVRVQRSLRDLQSQRPSLLWINIPGPRSRLTYRCSPRVVGRQPDSGKELLMKDGRHLALKANRRIPQWQETSLKGLTDRCCHLRVRLATSVPMEGRTVCALQTAASEPPPISTAMHFAIFL